MALIMSQLIFAQSKNETPKEYFYRGETTRSMYYAYILIKNSAEINKIEFEENFASTAFNYWILRKNNEITRNKAVEYWIKKMLTAKLLREEVLNDPLSRNKKVGHLAGPIKIHIDEKNYPILVKDFINFTEALMKDDSIPDE